MTCSNRESRFAGKRSTVLGVLFSGLGVYLLSLWLPGFYSSKIVQAQVARIAQGQALASHADYPVVVHDGGLVMVDKDRVVRMARLLTHKRDHRAASELHYLVKNGHVLSQMSDAESMIYADFLDSYSVRSFDTAEREIDECLSVYKAIVNGIGVTLSGSPVELVLHDVRNPPASIIAVQNTITHRRLGGSLTDFGVKLIKCYATYPLKGESHIAYPLTLSDGRQIKASTIPLYHPKYGLVAFICVNIDTTGLASSESEQAASVLRALTAVFPNRQIEELLTHPISARPSPEGLQRPADHEQFGPEFIEPVEDDSGPPVSHGPWHGEKERLDDDLIGRYRSIRSGWPSSSSLSTHPHFDRHWSIPRDDSLE